MRPLWWDFSGDAMAYSAELDDQYMLGPALLVAPVVVQVRISLRCNEGKGKCLGRILAHATACRVRGR